jgi:dihydropteroate synthase
MTPGFMDKTLAYELECGPFRLTLGKRTLIMGVLNVTPDSFSDGGLFFDKDEAIAQGEALAASGADIIDVGGESTRPFSQAVPVEEEIRRVVPVIEKLTTSVSVPISIDTSKAEVARRAIAVGASIVNDIGALTLDPAMAEVVVDTGVPVILMHMKGTPNNMQADPFYEDVVADVKDFLANAIHRATQAGIARNKIIVDPGIGFGKTLTDNLLLIKNLSAFYALEAPVLIGPSRKSFIASLLGDDKERREVGTQATVAVTSLQGVHMVRVHDVERTKYTLKIVEAIRNAV